MNESIIHFYFAKVDLKSEMRKKNPLIIGVSKTLTLPLCPSPQERMCENYDHLTNPRCNKIECKATHP
jgi:hypothetical protein